MYNQIMNAIASKLEELFPEAAITVVPLNGEPEAPCFEVRLLETLEKPLNGRRYLRSVGMGVKYFQPDSQEKSRNMNQVLGVLMDRMECISLENGSCIRGSNRSGKNEDGVLNFRVDYQVFVSKAEEPEDPMEEVSFA